MRYHIQSGNCTRISNLFLFSNFDKKQKSLRLNGKNHCSKNGCSHKKPGNLEKCENCDNCNIVKTKNYIKCENRDKFEHCDKHSHKKSGICDNLMINNSSESCKASWQADCECYGEIQIIIKTFESCKAFWQVDCEWWPVLRAVCWSTCGQGWSPVGRRFWFQAVFYFQNALSTWNCFLINVFMAWPDLVQLDHKSNFDLG